MQWKSIRGYENLHIIIWLVKDTCWVMDFKTLGVISILPAVTMAFFIAWHTRHSVRDFWHNLAVCAWIMANSVWMLGEFFYSDGTRPFALIFFLLGFACIGTFYIFLRRKTSDPHST